MKKYKLTEEKMEYNGRTLYRIEALQDFNDVKVGDKGGFVEKEDNLSQDGDAWVYGDAKVCGGAWVNGNAKVYGNAVVYGDAWVYGDAEVSGNVCVYGDAEVYDNACICGSAKVYGDARVSGSAKVYGDAWVGGDAELKGNAKVSGDADYIVFKNWWSSGRYFTWTRSNNKWKVGCFYGTGEELIAKAYKDSELSGREYARIVRYVAEIINETTLKI